MGAGYTSTERMTSTRPRPGVRGEMTRTVSLPLTEEEDKACVDHIPDTILTDWNTGDHDEAGDEEATHDVKEGMHAEIQPAAADQQGAGPGHNL